MHFIHTSFVHLKMDICEFVYSLTLKVSRHRVTAEASDGTVGFRRKATTVQCICKQCKHAEYCTPQCKNKKKQSQKVSLCAYIGEYFVHFETAVLKQTKTSYGWLSWRYLFDDAGEIYVTFINAFEHFYDNFFKKHLQNFITFDGDL